MNQCHVQDKHSVKHNQQLIGIWQVGVKIMFFASGIFVDGLLYMCRLEMENDVEVIFNAS